MSHTSREELVEAWREKYLQASKAEKREILNHLVEGSGYNRKYLIRKLRHPRRSKGFHRRGRKRQYLGEVIEVLKQVWEWSDRICSKRLKPYLGEFIEKLEKHGHLHLDPSIKSQLLRMSAASMDRYLKAEKYRNPSRGLATTKPGTLLKSQIPVRIYTPWDEQKAGFMEVDLVAHCYDTVAGQYHYTLTSTDIATGWTECVALPNKTQQRVNQAIELMRARLPFPLLGLDSDNGSEFINDLLLRYCKQEKITFTRCRAYHKNDQAHVEQKNWSVVRHVVGYDRFTTPEQLDLLNQIYLNLHDWLNFFQPVMKLVRKETIGSKTTKKYDTPSSPFQRVLALNRIPEDPACQDQTDRVKTALIKRYNQLDPVELWEKRNQLTARILKIDR